MKKWSKILAILIVGTLAALVGGCAAGGKKASDTSASGKREIVNMLYWPGPESEAMSKVIAKYNEGQGAKDGVEVKMLPAPREGFWEKEAAMMAANSQDVDIYFTATYKIGEHKGHLVPLQDKIEGLNMFIDTSINALKNEGNVYGIPMDISNHFLYYRKDLIEKLLSDANWQAKYREISKQIVGKELSPKDPKEWDWDDFIATSAFFTKQYNPVSPTEYGTALQLKNLIYNVMIWNDVLYSFGGSWYTKDGKPNFDTEEARKALQVYVDIFKKKLTPPTSTTFEYPETNQAFQTEKVALILQWSAAYHELTDKSKSEKVYDKVGIAPIPGPKHATHIHVLGVGLNKSSPKQEAALKWLKYLATKDAMKVYAENGGIPPVKDILEGMKDKRPEFPYIAEHSEKYGFVEDTSGNVFPVLEIMAKYLSAAWVGQIDIDSALKKVQEEVSQKVGK
ncbi:multiple sugar transport system substrate-binding protein [Thermanaeromonas toyohensis ToBE]|uniref:Multiple sugar transport system substrate-binding protein n=1 Tax=Thermanaeromonas toyohensis ToBE TaxID=698762 RepID=A0A1W1W211_9FIRM|nr:sugar ABC transporter substrate-binding protein [Thermanaeromonas toyohensis]SMB99626.1 multiple sugar transport system substrate-binding protein [Thermanaeromonas toyohensis ToBE]